MTQDVSIHGTIDQSFAAQPVVFDPIQPNALSRMSGDTPPVKHWNQNELESSPLYKDGSSSAVTSTYKYLAVLARRR